MKVHETGRMVLRGFGFSLRVTTRVVAALFVLTVLTLSGLGYYVNRNFSPEDARRLAVEQLTAMIHRETVIDRLVLSPYGIKVLGLRIRRGGSAPDLLSCDSALVTVRLRALLKRKIEFDSVLLESPRISLIRDEDGHWDLADVFGSSQTAATPPSGILPLALAAASTVVSDGVLQVEDRARNSSITLDKFTLKVDGFVQKRAFPVSTSFLSHVRLGEHEIEARLSAQGSVDLAGLNWSSATARAQRVRLELAGVPITGSAQIKGFVTPRLQANLSAPEIEPGQWSTLLGHDLPLTLPESHWRFKGGLPAAGMFDVSSLSVETADGSAEATGLFDFGAAKPSLSVEATFTDVPLARAGARYEPWSTLDLKGRATLRVDVAGWLGRLQAREAELTLRGFGGAWGDRGVSGVDLDAATADEFSKFSATLSKGRVAAYGGVFEDLSGTLVVDGKWLSIERFAMSWADSHVKLRARVRLPAPGEAAKRRPREVVLSGSVDKLDWERTRRLIDTAVAEISSRTVAMSSTTESESRPWVRTFKYAIPHGLPDSTGHVRVGEVVQSSFTCKNVDLMWSLRDVTPKLDKVSGEARLSFGPGRVADIPAMQDASKIMRIVFLPFVFMHKMNSLSVFNTAAVYPKSLDFARIEGEYGVAKGVARTRYFYVDSPQLVAYADGTADFGHEKVDMNILTRLTSVGGGLPEWWVDEAGRIAIGFHVKGDMNKPELEPGFKKIEENAIEGKLDEGRAHAKKRYEALEKLQTL